MRTLIRTTAVAAITTTISVVGTLTPSSASADAGSTASTLEHVCLGQGGSFHVNTYDGTNLICSAPRYVGDFSAVRTLCDRADGTFRHTQILDGRASWFCHTTA